MPTTATFRLPDADSNETAAPEIYPLPLGDTLPI